MKLFMVSVMAVLCVVMIFIPSRVSAQSAPAVRPGLYEVQMETGNYRVNLSQVTSISMHRFYVDAAFSVDEIKVDTLGNTVTRFYFVDRNKDVTAPRGVGQSVVDQVNEKVDMVKEKAELPSILETSVVKNYPTSAHAHTVEYWIKSKKQLDELYAHMTSAWERGRAGKFKVE